MVLNPQQGTPSRVVCRGRPPWEGLVGTWRGAVQLGKSKGRIGPQLAAESGCLRAEVPRPPRVMGAPSTGTPG